MRSRSFYRGMVFSTLSMAPLQAAPIDDHKLTIETILTAADRLCNIIKLKGSQGSSEIRGDIKAELKGLASKLASGGVSVGGGITNEEYENVIREDLAATLRDNAACKLKVFETLQEKLLNVPKDAPPKPRSRSENTGASQVGIWRGSVICRNGRNFSVTLSLRENIGRSITGDWTWYGSATGRDDATLSPDPAANDQASYVLITAKQSTYKYRLKLIDSNRMQGMSMGAERCDIVLDR